MIVVLPQTLQRELTGRCARVEEVLDRAGIIASLRTPEVDFVREGAGHVRQLWEVLRLEAERRSVMLDAVLQAQQYYSEAVKVESWLSGQKLQVANEEKGTVRNRPAHLSINSIKHSTYVWLLVQHRRAWWSTG